MNLNLAQTDNTVSLPNELVLEYFATSIALGVILMILAVWTSRKISERFTDFNSALRTKTLAKAAASTTSNPDQSTGPAAISYPELILGSANVLFLCFGMTGIMILVNNNLARAFAIGAAIAVVRFRIKFDSQGLGSTLFFGVLVGMACGVGQLLTATVITVAYGVLQMIVIFLMILANNKVSPQS